MYDKTIKDTVERDKFSLHGLCSWDMVYAMRVT